MKTMKDNKQGKCAMLDSVYRKTTSAIGATALILAFGVGLFVMEAAASVQEGILNSGIRIPHVQDFPTFSEKTARLVGSTDPSKKRLEIFGVSMDDVIEIPSKEDLEKHWRANQASKVEEFEKALLEALQKAKAKPKSDRRSDFVDGKFQAQWGFSPNGLKTTDVLDLGPEWVFSDLVKEIGKKYGSIVFFARPKQVAAYEEEIKAFRMKVLKEDSLSKNSSEVTKDDIKEQELEKYLIKWDSEVFRKRQEESVRERVESEGLKLGRDSFPSSLEHLQIRGNIFRRIEGYLCKEDEDSALQGIVWKGSLEMPERAEGLCMECCWLQEEGSRTAKPFYVFAQLGASDGAKASFEKICKALERKYGSDLIQTMYSPQGMVALAQYVMNGDAVKIKTRPGMVEIFIVNNDIVGKFHEAAEERRRQKASDRDKAKKARDAQLDAI